MSQQSPASSGNSNNVNNPTTTTITTSATDTSTTTTDNSTTAPTTSSPRWRFDIDLNFDPSQIANSATALTMLNTLDDWIPYNFRRSTSTSTTINNNNNNSTESGVHRAASLNHHHQTSSNTMGRLPATRTRPSSNNSTRGNSTSASSLFPSSSSNNHLGSETSSNTNNHNNSLITDDGNHTHPNYNSSPTTTVGSSRSRMPYHNIDIEANGTTAITSPTTITSHHAQQQQGSVVVDMDMDMADNWSSTSASINNGSSSPTPHGHHHHHVHSQDEERGGGGRRTPPLAAETNHLHTPPPPASTPAELFRNSPEGQRIISVAERYSPFLLILLVKQLFDHGTGIVSFLILLMIFSHANSLFKKEVSKQGKRKICCLLMIIVNLCVCTGFILYLYQDDKLYLGLLFLPTNTVITSMWTMFWVTAVVDFIAKFITIILKVFVLMCPGRVCPYQKRGKYYLFVERTSQLYRTSIPLYPWVIYMSGKYEGPSSVIGGFLVLLYCALKLSDISKRYSAWRVSFFKLLQQVHYGETPSETELKEAGDLCPICHDSFQNPTKLKCSHLFCEECVTTWFDREKTCPLCRHVINDDPVFRDGATSFFIQVF